MTSRRASAGELAHSICVDSDTGYFLIIVFGLPVLLMLLTGPAMRSEKWGWRALDRLERLFRRTTGKRLAAVRPAAGQSPPRRR